MGDTCMSSEIKKEFAVVVQKLDNLEGWIKEISLKIIGHSDRLRDNEKEIALLKQRNELQGNMESWSRKKLVFFGGVVVALVLLLIELFFEFILKPRLFGG